MLRETSGLTAAPLGVAMFLVACVAAGAEGQGSIGKVQGRVVTSTGQPVASAQVTVDGTNLGNITNDEGFYFINNVPAGLFTVRAQSIGYRTVATTNQRVLAGQTTTLNFVLEQSAVELQALVVAGDRNPLVARDQLSSKGIIMGDIIASMPIDRASYMILLGPGVIDTNTGFSIRGAREGEHAVYVDGVPLRSLRTGATSNLELPTNALAQVDVTTGTVSARYGNAQSGLVNYITRTGGTQFGGMLAFRTDDFSPKEWRTGFNRLELSLGGPLPINDLSFFVGGTAEGKRYRTMSQRFNHLDMYVPSGVDTVIRLARTSQTAGGFDSVDVVIPNYVLWDNGPTSPSQVSDRYNLTAKLSWGLGRGSKVDLTYYRDRSQSLNRNWLYGVHNSDSWTGSYTTQNTVTLGGYFLLAQSAERALALDVKASYQRDWNQSGNVTQKYLNDHLNPPLGFNAAPIDFILDPDAWPVTEMLVNASRSDHLPESENVLLPGRADLTQRQGVEGVTDNLRINPYALRTSFPISGSGNVGQAYSSERRWYTTATIDWQMNRFNRIWFGGELTMSQSAGRVVPLYQNRTNPFMNEPTVAGLFLQNRADLGDVVLEAGVRLDYFDPAGDFPRVPGFVFNIPDSLRKDTWTLAEGEGSTLERMRPPAGDCGGAATAQKRTNPITGELVCKSNFIPTRKRALFSPKVAASFPVTATSTFRMSWGQSAQPPRLATLLSGNEDDLAGGTANTNWTFGRDVDIPNTRAVEVGYRQVFGGKTVLDVSGYSRTTRNSLSYRKLPFKDPNTGVGIYINVLQNADYSLSRGVDVSFDQRLSEILDLGLKYSLIDARGTGSDPTTYTALLLRSLSNLSVLTGEPIEAPEVLLPLDQSRAHNLFGVLAITFGDNFAAAGPVARSILNDLSVFATVRLASGLPYGRLVNDANGQIGPPTRAGLVGTLAEPLNSSRTAMERRFDMRLVKGFRLFGRGARISADLRNPLGLVNRDVVWLETGTETNALYRDEYIRDNLDQGLLYGAAVPFTDVNIREKLELNNPVNQYMLLQAEKRFGNGDGVLTGDEQRNLMTSLYNLEHGPHNFRESDRYLRLGFEIVF